MATYKKLENHSKFDRVFYNDLFGNFEYFKFTTDDIQQQIDNLVLSAGDSSPEVTQARGAFTTLDERLDDSDTVLNDLKIMHIMSY